MKTKMLLEAGIHEFEKLGRWPMLRLAAVPMQVKVPLSGISLRVLGKLEQGMVLESAWQAGEEVPLYAADVLVSWGEFEVADGQIAVRLTRLA